MNFQILREHLSDPEYIHVLVNPLPVYGLAMATLALVLALLLRNQRLTIAAFVLVFVSAISAWPQARRHRHRRKKSRCRINMMIIRINFNQLSFAIALAALLAGCAFTDAPPLAPGNPADPHVRSSTTTPRNLLARDQTTLEIENELSQTESTQQKAPRP